MRRDAGAEKKDRIRPKFTDKEPSYEKNRISCVKEIPLRLNRDRDNRVDPVALVVLANVIFTALSEKYASGMRT